MAPVSGAVSRAVEWAETPARSAWGSRRPEPSGESGGGEEAGQSEPGHGQGPAGNGPQRGQDGVADRPGLVQQRTHQAPVGGAVGAEGAGGLVQRRVGGRGLAAVEGMGEGTSGWRSEARSPSKAGWRKNGEATTRGWTVEQTS